MSECYCDYNGPEVYTESEPKAIKDHKCCECHGVIKKGETYHFIKGKWDGDWESFKMCGDCKSIWCQFNCGCIVEYGGLYEFVDQSQDAVMIGMFQAIKRERCA